MWKELGKEDNGAEETESLLLYLFLFSFCVICNAANTHQPTHKKHLSHQNMHGYCSEISCFHNMQLNFTGHKRSIKSTLILSGVQMKSMLLQAICLPNEREENK